MSYATDLAYIHDAGFGGFSADAGPGLVKRFRAQGIRKGLIVDLGCGSGIWAAHATHKGYEVFGIDQSAAMVKLAKKQAPKAKFRVASFFDAELPPCDVVTSLGECLGYRFDPKSSMRALNTVFRKVHGALRPGGLFVFDLAGPKRGKIAGRHMHWFGNDWAILLDETKTKDSRRLSRAITTFRRRGSDRYSRSDEVHDLWLHPPRDVLAALRRLGFTVSTVRQYGKTPFPKGLVGYIARK